jgi:hypothetical protein
MEFNKAYDREEFLTFLKDKFLPEEDFVKEETVLPFPVQTTYSTKATRLGVCHDTLDLEVYEIRHTSRHDARVGLSKEAFRLLAEEGCARALVLFVPEDNDSNYRFSLIEITLNIKEDSNKIDKRYSNPHRYSYYLGKDIAYHTPNKYLNEKGRVIDEDDLRERFSVEVLTKEFYSELSDWYAWAVRIIRFPNDITTTLDDAKFNQEGGIRLITRLIFVWFLKQRHLVPDEFFDEQYIAEHLIDGFNPHQEDTLFGKSYASNYYRAILQNLFFAMLNCPITKEGSDEITERKFKDGRPGYDDNKLMRYKDLFKDPDLFVKLANETVPFLNGGLFDCLDDKDNGMYYDGFSERTESIHQLCVPDFLFFGEEVGKNIDLSEFYGDKKKKKVSARGIIDILKRYNFTVEENTPFDQEVSLDPELLGKVFENLLASYNPETQTTARKQTGSFYTPREIVQYMVEESLVAHLKRTVGEEYESEYRQLMEYTDDEIKLSDEIKHQIITSLYNCKILDPACGSGAFPMGMLQQMVHILSRLDPNNEQWKSIMMEDAIAATSDAYRNSTDDERKEVVADIERSFDEAINRPDYARKLYLIENCIYGVDIQPIAIQISKLRFFISLVVDQITNTDATDNFGIRPLPNLEAKFVAANTLMGLDKKDASLFDSELIKQKEKEMAIAKHKIFGAKTVRTKRKYKEQVKTIRLEIATMLEENGIVGNEEAQQLSQWDMFDQNASSPFFDPEWMFDIKEGFDIVIANPPYVFTRDVDFGNDFKKYIEKEYFSKVKILGKKTKANQSGKINLYSVFIMKGILLCSKAGILNYIVPNNILRTTIYDIVRKYILDNTCINQIVDLGSGVFDSVTASTIIMQIANTINISNNLCSITDIKNLQQQQFNISNISQDQFKNNISYSFNIYGDNKSQSIISKIEKSNYRLGDICLYISPGIDGNKDKYVSKYKIDEMYKPLLYGKNIKRYHINFDNNYILYDKNLLNRSRNETIFKSNKIILQRISGGEQPITATIDNGNYYTFNSVNNIILKDDLWGLKVIVSILNSKIINWYYANNFSNKSNLTVNISKTYLEKLPIQNIDEINKKKIIKLVDEIIQLKNNYPPKDTSSFENEIDFIIYKLYNLTYEEVKIVDPETPIIKEEYEI